jgi:integrase
MGTADPQHFERTLRLERERLDNEAVVEADREAILAWARRRDGQVAVSTLGTYLMRLRRAAEESPVPLVELGEEDYHDLVWRLRNEANLSDTTVRNYENALCLWLSDYRGLDWPDDVDRTRTDDSGPDPAEMLGPAEIQALVDAARSQRDVALIEFLADTGARIGLTCSLRVRDVSLDSDRPTFQPNPESLANKDVEIVERPLIDCRGPLKTYLRQAHPRPNEPDAALFHLLKGYDEDVAVDDGACEPSPINEHLSRIAERAGVEKPTNPHNFRHSAITRMVREGYDRPEIEHRVGWSVDSDMWETYQHVSAEEHNEGIFAAAGFVADDGADRTRRPCGTCGERLAPHHDYCPVCGDAASPDARRRTDDATDTVLEELVRATDQATRQQLRSLLDAVESDPSAHGDASSNSSGS